MKDALLNCMKFKLDREDYIMKIYIQTDIEGVTGFCFFEHHDQKVGNVQHRYRMYGC